MRRQVEISPIGTMPDMFGGAKNVFLGPDERAHRAVPVHSQRKLTYDLKAPEHIRWRFFYMLGYSATSAASCRYVFDCNTSFRFIARYVGVCRQTSAGFHCAVGAHADGHVITIWHRTSAIRVGILHKVHALKLAIGFH